VAKAQLVQEALRYSNSSSQITLQIFMVQDANEIASLMAKRAEYSSRVTNLIAAIDEKLESNREQELFHEVRVAREPYVASYTKPSTFWFRTWSLSGPAP
jgi:hypothetical protein